MDDYCNHEHDSAVGHAFINAKGAGSKEVRIVKNDPTYERIDALRQAREYSYYAKIYLIVGLITLPLLGIGIIFLIIAWSCQFNASRLEYKFKE